MQAEKTQIVCTLSCAGRIALIMAAPNTFPPGAGCHCLPLKVVSQRTFVEVDAGNLSFCWCARPIDRLQQQRALALLLRILRCGGSDLDDTLSMWWFQIFLFSPLPGEMIQFDEYFPSGLKPPTIAILLVYFLHLFAVFESGNERVWRLGLLTMDLCHRRRISHS